MLTIYYRINSDSCINFVWYPIRLLHLKIFTAFKKFRTCCSKIGLDRTKIFECGANWKEEKELEKLNTFKNFELEENFEHIRNWFTTLQNFGQSKWIGGPMVGALDCIKPIDFQWSFSQIIPYLIFLPDVLRQF